MAAMKGIAVLLVDDHPVVATGLADALSGQEGITVAAVAGTLAAARSMLATESFDVGLVDVRLPDGIGLDLISKFPRASGGPAWIVLSTFDLTEYIVVAFQRGASGYLLKTAPLADIVDSIRRVAAGGTAFEAGQLSAIAVGRVRLSPRERQVIAGVVASRSNDEIAGDLGVTRKTVESYLSRLFERLEVTSWVELALRAEREGWLDLD
jgi:two-component system response regulator DesR